VLGWAPQNPPGWRGHRPSWAGHRPRRGRRRSERRRPRLAASARSRVRACTPMPPRSERAPRGCEEIAWTWPKLVSRRSPLQEWNHPHLFSPKYAISEPRKRERDIDLVPPHLRGSTAENTNPTATPGALECNFLNLKLNLHVHVHAHVCIRMGREGEQLGGRKQGTKGGWVRRVRVPKSIADPLASGHCSSAHAHLQARSGGRGPQGGARMVLTPEAKRQRRAAEKAAQASANPNAASGVVKFGRGSRWG
jgi:hypothetical protein